MTHQRRARKDMRNRMAGEPSSSANDRPSRASPPPRGGKNNDDDELAAAIEASKRSAAEEANRHKGDSELEEALRLSREEDERRRRALEAGAGDNLFDEEQQRSVSRTLSSFVRYHAVGLPSFLRLAMAESSADIFPPRLGAQKRPHRHGRARTAAADADGLDVVQPVPGTAAGADGRVHAATAVARAPASGEACATALKRHVMTPSWTMILILCEYVDVPQQEQQQMLYAQQQQAAMQAQYQQQQAYEDYMRQQQMMYMQQQQQQPNQQPIQAQPTGFGANNPFAAFAPQASPSPAPPPPQQEPASNGFESSYRPEPAPAPAPVQEQQPQRTGGGRYKTGGDERHSELARMLAGGREDGLDTFGNVGATRVPVWQQKTGQGQGPMMPQTTGLAKPLNPFGTGVTTYRPQQFNQPTGQQQQQQQNVRSDLSPALLLATLSLSRALTSHALYPAERTALLHDLSRI